MSDAYDYAKVEDFSGVSHSTSDNPYDGLIEASRNDPKQIQSFYSNHRTTRNARQRSEFLSHTFCGPVFDTQLQRILDPSIEPGYVDPRHSLTIWARPPEKIRKLVQNLQQELLRAAPNLWLMPLSNLHLTVLEIAHSVTAPDIDPLVTALEPSIQTITDYTLAHRTRLIKPLLSYDTSGIALSFLPAACEGFLGSEDTQGQVQGRYGRTAEDDMYTFHHLRRDVYSLVRDAGVEIASRYIVPSAHLTIGRFITAADFLDSDTTGVVQPDIKKTQKWVDTIEHINIKLQESWSENEEKGGKWEWLVGEEKGLECRRGTLWYGGGETVRLGEGF